MPTLATGQNRNEPAMRGSVPHDMVFAACHSKVRVGDTPVDEATRDQHEAGTIHSSSGGEPTSDQMTQVPAFHKDIYI